MVMVGGRFTSRVDTFKLEGFLKPYPKSSRDFDHG